MGIEDEVRRIRQQEDAEARRAADEARDAAAKAVVGQERLRQLGREILVEFEKHDPPKLSRFRLTPKRFSKDLYRIESMGEQVWALGVNHALTRSGLICGWFGTWYPEDLSTPQSRRRGSSYPNSRIRAADEPGQCIRLAKSEGSIGLYEDTVELTVSGSAPSGYMSKEDLVKGVWFDGEQILFGDQEQSASFVDHLSEMAAQAIVNRSRR